MSALRTACQNLIDLVESIAELASYLLLFVSAFVAPRAQAATTIVALSSQLAACQQRVEQKKEPRPRFRPAFRVLWVILSRVLEGWEDLGQLMKPATVKRWHKQGWRLYWCWRSRRRGRPALDQEMRGLIRKLSRKNPLWSAERIRDTLSLLGFDPPCDDTVCRYMVRPRKPREPSTTWLPFLRNHLDVSWAIDFFTATTLSFATLYVFLVFEHGRRRVVHLAVTRSPNMAWVTQQLCNAMPFGLQPQYLFRDNDGIYGHGVALFLQRCGIREVRTALQSPWQNPYVERFIGTLRRELLNHVIVLNEPHLERLLREFIEEYYHVARPHQGLGGDTPIPTQSPPDLDGPTTLVATPVLGGLHHRYQRRAA
jgi:transposase InsO family protein